MVHLVTPSLALVGVAGVVMATVVVALLGWGPQLVVEQRRVPERPERGRSTVPRRSPDRRTAS